MQVQERIQQPLGHVVPFAPEAQPLADARFRDLLGAGWNRLPAAIKRRFGKRLKGGDSVAYQGVVTMMRMNRAGWVLAQLARLVGAPLPFDLSSWRASDKKEQLYLHYRRRRGRGLRSRKSTK